VQRLTSARESGCSELDVEDVFGQAPNLQQERDFARIYDSSGVYVVNNQQLKLLRRVQASKSPVGSDNGSANEDAVEEFLGLLRDHDPQRVVKSFTDEELRRYVAKQISVDQSFQFCMREKVQPLFLQPRYVVLLSPTEGIVVVTYGFVAESASDVAGDRPDTKHTPWIARLEMHVTNGTLTHTILPKAEYWTTTEFLAHDHATILRQKYFGGAGAAGS